MPLDLRSIQPQVAELILVDLCTLWRDPEGTSDDVLNTATLSYAVPSDFVAVETDLACGVRWQMRGGYVGESGQPLVVTEYDVKFAQPFTNILIGDRVEITQCVHDPQLVGRNLKVVEVLHGSLSIFKKVRAQMRLEGVDQP